MQDGGRVGYLRCINNYAIFSAAVMNLTSANAQVVRDLIGMYGSMGTTSSQTIPRTLKLVYGTCCSSLSVKVFVCMICQAPRL